MPVTSTTPLTMVLPMLNEAESAARVVTELFDAFADRDRVLHVVCVNDGSTDQTAQVLAGLQGAHAALRVETHETRCGYGAAIRTGLATAETSLVGWMDGDGQYDPNDLHVLIAAIEAGAIGGIGVRTNRADDPHRRLLGKSGSLLASAICRHRLEDADAGLKVFDRNRLDLGGLQANGSYISTEVLARALRTGTVKQIPIGHRPREAGTQTGASLRVLIGLATDCVRCNRPRTQRLS